MKVEDSDDEYKHYYDMNMLLCITCFKISSFPFTEILKKKMLGVFTLSSE